MAQMRHLKSMEFDDEEKLDHMPVPQAPNKPEFPYGLRISLTEKEFEKLDLDHSNAEVGCMVHGHFMGRITSVSHDEMHDGEGEPKAHCRVEIQIEDLDIESEDEENEGE